MRRLSTVPTLGLALALAFTLTAACDSGGSAPPPAPVPAAPPAQPAGSKFTVDYMTAGFPPVQVEVLKAGSGKLVPFGGMLTIHYTGNAIGKPAYDSSRGKEPKEVAAGVGKVLPGVDAALIKMREGDHWKLTIPAELGFGDKAGPKVPANSVLEFEVEVVKVLD
jgi:FKBP-type peptidyl-prolyl cis-trans isomerase